MAKKPSSLNRLPLYVYRNANYARYTTAGKPIIPTVGLTTLIPAYTNGAVRGLGYYYRFTARLLSGIPYNAPAGYSVRVRINTVNGYVNVTGKLSYRRVYRLGVRLPVVLLSLPLYVTNGAGAFNYLAAGGKYLPYYTSGKRLPRYTLLARNNGASRRGLGL